MARTHGSTSFVTVTIDDLLNLGFTNNEPLLVSRIHLQKKAAENITKSFFVAPPVKEKEPEATVEVFEFAD